MKKKIQLTLLSILSIFSAVYSQENKAAWQIQPITIDGKASDWVTNPRYFNAAAKVQYEFRNDARNLFVIIKTNDRSTQTQFMRAGFAVKFKIKSEPRLIASMAFPPLNEGMMPPIGNTRGGEDEKLVEKSAMKPGIIAKDSAYLEGFLFAKNSIASENKDEKNICFAKSINREGIIYEIRIPFREFFGDEYVIADIITIPIQLQVTINGGSSKGGNRSSGRMGGSGRDRGMRGRNRGGEMPGGGMSDDGMQRGGDQDMEDRSSMQRDEMRFTATAAKKSFNIGFNLSNGK